MSCDESKLEQHANNRANICTSPGCPLRQNTRWIKSEVSGSVLSSEYLKLDPNARRILQRCSNYTKDENYSQSIWNCNGNISNFHEHVKSRKRPPRLSNLAKFSPIQQPACLNRKSSAWICSSKILKDHRACHVFLEISPESDVTMLVEICATPSSLIVDQGKSSQKFLRPSPTLQGSLSWSSTSDEWNLHIRNPDRWSNPWKGSEVHRSSIKFVVFFLHSSFFYRANSQWLSWLCVCALVSMIYDHVVFGYGFRTEKFLQELLAKSELCVCVCAFTYLQKTCRWTSEQLAPICVYKL